ncbi:MAG: hypothetical protein AB8B97_12430 [Granulosicoccus sp.]
MFAKPSTRTSLPDPEITGDDARAKHEHGASLLVYGAQQLTLFNKRYGTWCYLPVACFLLLNDEQTAVNRYNSFRVERVLDRDQ